MIELTPAAIVKVFGRLRSGELRFVEFDVKAWSFGKAKFGSRDTDRNSGWNSEVQHKVLGRAEALLQALTMCSSSFVVQGAMLGIRIRFKALLASLIWAHMVEHGVKTRRHGGIWQ